MRSTFIASIAVLAAISIAPSALARERSHVFSYERSSAAALIDNSPPTVLVFTRGGPSPAQVRDYEAVLAERPYRWAHVLIVDVEAAPAAARRVRAFDAPSFTVLRAGGDYFHAGQGALSATALRRELDAALRAPVARASVD